MIEELSQSFKVIGSEINGQDAIERLKSEQIDIVLTDIRMPVMDGLKLLKAISADWPDCITVIISGHQDFAYTQSALRLGAFDYLLKPVSRENLRELLDRLEEAHARSLLKDTVTAWRIGESLVETLTVALCTRNEIQIGYDIETIVDAAVKDDMSQAALTQLLETVVNDERLSLDKKMLSHEISEVISSATSSASLKDNLTRVFNIHALSDSKIEMKKRVLQIEQYLSAHFTDDISSELLSSRFGFVPSYLSKIFRRQTGLSPTEYLTRLRIEKAKELLETKKDLLIRDAANLVGYKDPYYFSKIFKKTTGVWPSQYQENAAVR